MAVLQRRKVSTAAKRQPGLLERITIFLKVDLAHARGHGGRLAAKSRGA